MPKKMRQMCFCFILMTAACTAAFCQGKRFMAEMDISGLAGGKAGLCLEYGITGHWSAGGRMVVGFGQFIKDMAPLDAVHRQEFGDDLSRPAPADFLTESIHARYWPVKVMKGPYALASVSHGNISGTDFCLGCGHLMHIWRCLNLYIEYRVGMKETIKADNFPVKGLSAGISLTFGKQK